jgi:hypothetical protein
MARRPALTEDNTLLPPEYSGDDEAAEADASVAAEPEDKEDDGDADDMGEPKVLPNGDWVYGAEEKVEEEEEDADIIDLENFFQNLAEDDKVLEEVAKMASAICEQVEEDIEARKDRDSQQAEGIKRTGLGKEAPGGADFEGASMTVHPILTEGCIDFAAHVTKELLPPPGPVKTHIIGKSTKEKVAKADRKRQHMNWQLTQQIKEYRTESEQLWTQLPLGGSGYLHWWYGKRPHAEFLPVDLVILAAHASSFETSHRITVRENGIGEEEFQSRIRAGRYRDPDTMPDTLSPDLTESQQATDKIEGKGDAGQNLEGQRSLYTIYTSLQLKSDKKAGGEFVPYKITIEQATNTVLEVVRNWDPTLDEDEKERMNWLVQWDFIRWRGALGIGLGQMIGSMAGSITGGIRALLDSAHINNAATLIKLKGANIGGQSTSIDITGVAEIEGPAGLDDIRKLAMPLPFNPPSTVLFSLVELLIKEARSTLANSEDAVQAAGPNTPVATMMAVVESGAVTFSSIHARMHECQRRSFEILHRINKFWLDDEQVIEDLGELVVRREDYEGPMDIIPVSDPAIFSEMQRATQVQGVLDLNTLFPGLMPPRALLKRALQVLKIPDTEELLPEEVKPTPKNPVAENLEMFMGQPAFAFPDQDQEAHLQTHIAFLLDPHIGSNPAFVNSLVPQMLEHCKQHIGFWYVDTALGVLSSISGQDMSQGDYSSPEAQDALARALAEAAPFIMQESSRVLGQIGPILGKMSEISGQMQEAQMQQQLAMNGKSADASRMAEVNRKTQADQGNLQIKGQQLALQGQQMKLKETEMQARSQERMAKFQSDEKRLMMEATRGERDSMTKLQELRQRETLAQREDSVKRLALQMQRLAAEEGNELDTLDLENDIRRMDIDLLKNEQDNFTALKIAQEDHKAGKKAKVSNGNSIGA